MEINNIYNGDCLEIMKTLTPNSIDLIYLDPPYFSGRKYDNIGKNKGITSFDDDCWFDVRCKCGEVYSDIKGIKRCEKCGDLINPETCTKKPNKENYIDWLSKRLQLCHRLLKNTGTIYLHLDDHAVYEMKIEMDKIFGSKNFKNGIIWTYSGGSVPKKDFPRKHDTILRYTKSNDWTFNIEYKPYTEATLKSGKHFDGSPLRKEGTPITDYWDDINPATGWSNESLGYPTQKPIKLLERIINASSNPGDLVMDPFVGSGTTIHAAKKCGRNYIGIDKSPAALKVIQERINIDPKLIDFGPKSIEDLKNMTHFDFEEWVVIMLNGTVTKKTGDKGIDGYTIDDIPIQVKQSENIGDVQIRAFLGSMIAKKYKEGIFVALGFKSDIDKTIKDIKENTGIIIKLYSAHELLGRNNDGYIKNCVYTKTLDNWF